MAHPTPRDAPAPLNHHRRLTLATLAAAPLSALAGCAAVAPPPSPPVDMAPDALLPAALQPPPAPRELRGAWVATVANIDWPSRPGLGQATQRAEALALLDAAAGLRLNALMLQVRPAADAIYPSALEPWSEYLSGTQGQAPGEGFDPLAFWLAEAHRRGLQLHAWFNPYRARHSAARSAPAPTHVALRQPELVRRYGDQLWLDPAEPGAAAHTLAVVADVLQRYDLDGVHLDDYFYPYPVREGQGAAARDLPFPDDAAWARHLQQVKAGLAEALPRDDWRRAQVNALVVALQQTVRRLKPAARFGISPFGLPQPAARPPGISGFSQYDKLYADVERWLREGWMDYLAPQLYWPRARAAQAFDSLLGAWAGLNPRGLGLWPGLFTSKVGAPQQAWPADELLGQVTLLRERPAAGGHIHFSLIALAQDRGGLATRLRDGPYQHAALVPAWDGGLAGAALLQPAPAAPQVLRQPAALNTSPASASPAGGGAGTGADSGGLAAPAAAALWRLQPGPAEPGTPAVPVWQWAVWRRVAGAWQFSTQPGADTTLAARGADALVVSAVSRSGHESPRRAVPVAPATPTAVAVPGMLAA